MPGVGYVLVDGIAEPVRVRFSHITDQHIGALVNHRSPLVLVPGEVESSAAAASTAGPRNPLCTWPFPLCWCGCTRSCATYRAGLGQAAACASDPVDPDWWFTPADDERQTVARGICDTCPVRRSCLAYALMMNESDGIWGCFDDTERIWLRFALAEGIRVTAVLDPHTRTAVA